MDINVLMPNYNINYYGLDSDATLIIDDDRGKYIRDDATAEAFALWMLSWHMNQHLKMKVKLPLKYMNIEIGDTIEFDKILGDVKPYGIDYVSDNVRVNGQLIYPRFIVNPRIFSSFNLSVS